MPGRRGYRDAGRGVSPNRVIERRPPGLARLLLGEEKFLTERNWTAIKMMLPFFVEFKGRLALAFGCLAAIQATQFAVPWLLKLIVDSLDSTEAQIVALPFALLMVYVLVRFGSAALSELREAVFGTVTIRAMRRLSLTLLDHLLGLDLEYHVSRRTGAVSRDMDRGVMAITSLMRILTFQLLGMFIGVFGVAAIMVALFDWSYAVIILAAAVFYGVYTVKVTAWRTPFIRESNEANSRANTRAIDSLINYETVKTFGNESTETTFYDEDLAIWEKARARNRYSLAALNVGQSFIVHIGLLGMMIIAAMAVVDGSISIGSLVAINGYAVQVFVPLNALGSIYRQLKNAFTDVELMFDILETSPKVVSSRSAPGLPPGDGPVEFRAVGFAYQPQRPILKGIDFAIEPHQTLALVGPSGSGKSTIARLLFRFYDPDQGAIRVNGKDIRNVDVASLRDVFGVVPQDVTLFNDTLYHNIAYGRLDATKADVEQAAILARLDELIDRLPNGFDTAVGERGLKLSGGEKQRVAIARAILKDPTFLIFDEATSSLDTVTERAIMHAINEVSARHTTLIISHRLSTVVDADRIVLLGDGAVLETGDHAQLLAQQGKYAEMWTVQRKERAVSETHDATRQSA